MDKFIKYSLFVILIYVETCLLRFYVTDFFPTYEVKFSINSLYGQPFYGLSSFHVGTDIGDFQNRDSLVNWKHNSRDIKAYLSQAYKDGRQKECVATVNGPKSYTPFFSPNILSVECTSGLLTFDDLR